MVQVTEQVTRGKRSSLAQIVRAYAKADEFRSLRYITISQHAPEWRRQASAIDSQPKGLTSILACDRKGAREVWYKTATNGHRAKIFIREAHHESNPVAADAENASSA